MPEIFVSYSKKDSEFAKKLYSDLKSAGFDVWMDREGIRGGDQWRPTIEKNLKLADKVIVLISPNSMASDWVRHEGSMAYAWEKAIIPLLVGHVHSLPPWVEETQWIDFENQAYERALDALVFELTPRTLAQEYLDKQLLIYQNTGDLIGEARLRIIEEESESLSISPDKKELIELSRAAVLRVKRKRQAIIAVAILLFGAAVSITTLGATGNLNRLIYRPLPMDLVDIPAGEFLMGSPENDVFAENDEKPQRRVYLDAYQIGKFEVTNAQYLQCIKAGVCSVLPQFETIEPDQYDFPVIRTGWEEANTLCQWYGYRLPTEAEWEKAARGEDGWMYPWGNETPDCNRTNFRIDNCEIAIKPVGSYPDNASPYGAFDMAGNVWEWVADWYAPDYYAQAPVENPPGPAEYEEDAYRRILRGGSAFYEAAVIRAANRRAATPDTSNDNVGFRCAADATQ